MKSGPNGPNRWGSGPGVQGKFLLQDLRWDQGPRGPDPPVFESKQSLFERNQDTVVTHYFGGLADCGRQAFVKSEKYFLVSSSCQQSGV